LYLYDHEPWGHSIQRLVTDFPDTSAFPDVNGWIQRAASLDRYYITTRYPNGLPDLTPGESFFEQDAASAVDQASFFIGAAKRLIE
jgi:HEPN domain-containing protein